MTFGHSQAPRTHLGLRMRALYSQKMSRLCFKFTTRWLLALLDIFFNMIQEGYCLSRYRGVTTSLPQPSPLLLLAPAGSSRISNRSVPAGFSQSRRHRIAFEVLHQVSLVTLSGHIGAPTKNRFVLSILPFRV